MQPLLRWGSAAAVLAALAFALLAYFIAPIGTAYVAKTVCSGVFVSGRDRAEVHRLDVLADNNPLLPFITYAVDEVRSTVEARFFGMQDRAAQFRPGAGCALTYGLQLANRTGPSPANFAPLATADTSRQGPRADVLRQAVLDAFAEPNPNALRRTHAVVVLHRGKVVAQHYAYGFDAATPHVGWSMTKTVTGLLVGIRVAQGKLDLDGVALRPEWRDDGRAKISLAHLLRMSSGLAFDENYQNPRSDVVRMLYDTPDPVAYALRSKLVSEPGTVFRYSSGSTEILSSILRESFQGDDNAYWRFPQEALLRPLGVGTATFEVDASGNLVAASSMYAGAHDWARIGQLLLNRGQWAGREVVPEQWVRFMTTPAPAAKAREYGAHVWTSIPDVFRRASGERPSLPADTFHMIGHEGQFVSVVPSRDLVVVRLGLARLDHSWDHEAFLQAILQATSL